MEGNRFELLVDVSSASGIPVSEPQLVKLVEINANTWSDDLDSATS